MLRCEFLDQTGYLLDLKRSMGRRLNETIMSDDNALERNDRRSDRHFAVGHVDMRYTTYMPELQEDVPAPCVDRFRNPPPSDDLFL